MPTGFFNNGSNTATLLATDNVDFSGAANPAPSVTTDGQLLIGSTATPNIKVGSLTSPNGTITIGYSSPNITLDLTGGTIAIDSIAVDTTTGAGTNPVLPTAAGLITLTGGQYATGTFGTRVIDINSSAANTIQVLAQQTSAVAASDSTKNGIAHFNSAEFSVDSTGFVSLKSGGFIWNDVTSATKTVSVQNGYVTDRGGGVAYTLPSTASFGDEFIITGKSGLWTLAQNVNQSVALGSATTTVGVGGSLAATNAGDSITCVCITAGASTAWRVFSFVGNITVT